MNAALIQKTGDRLLWTPADLQQFSGIQYPSALVYFNRAVKRGDWLRIKNGVYLPAYRYRQLSREDIFRSANFLQVPSYISLTTALQFWNATTQVQQSTVESISPVRSNQYQTPDFDFRYFKIQKIYSSGFVRENGIFVATPEKALLDALYLQYLNQYSLDEDALEMARFNPEVFKKNLRLYRKNRRLYDFLNTRLCKIFKNMNNSK